MRRSREKVDPLKEIRKSIDEGQTPQLRLSQRRPSLPGAETVNRLQERELTIKHEGWLTKHSKTGLPNWNRRWFVLIGGTLYYSKTSESVSGQMQVFAELLHAQRIEAVSSDSRAFRLVMSEKHSETLHFQAASASARLEWMAVLESHLGMQPVPLEVLQNCMRKEEGSSGGDGGVRVRMLAAELADREAELHAAAEREAELRATIESMRLALTAKDEQARGSGGQECPAGQRRAEAGRRQCLRG